MQTSEKERHKVSWHLKDLMKRDVQSVLEVSKWLESNAQKPRDVANRTVSKRLLARMIAAQIALKAAQDGDISAAREVMDRTEGKVAQEVISYNGNELVKQLEAGRERLLQSRQPLQVVDGSIEGEVVTDASALTALDSKTSK